MRYLVRITSECNIFDRKIIVSAEDHKHCMIKAFAWLQEQEVWSHLWKVNISIDDTNYEPIEEVP